MNCRTCRQRVALKRDCCLTCYTRHAKAVRSGKLTWESLVARGLCSNAKKRPDPYHVGLRGRNT